MEEFIQFILEKDRVLIFKPEIEDEVIATILGDTKAYAKLQEETEQEIIPAEWVDREDIFLGNFSLNMFLRTRKLMGNEFELDEFKKVWTNYTQTEDYYIQIANYMINSDDYRYADRYKLKNGETPTLSHKSNLIKNMQELQQSFQGNPVAESLYVQKVGLIGKKLFKIINT